MENFDTVIVPVQRSAPTMIPAERIEWLQREIRDFLTVDTNTAPRFALATITASDMNRLYIGNDMLITPMDDSPKYIVHLRKGALAKRNRYHDPTQGCSTGWLIVFPAMEFDGVQRTPRIVELRERKEIAR